jgi:hypothetical protein
MTRIRLQGFALLLTVLAATTAAGTAAVTPTPAPSFDIRPSETIITFPAGSGLDGVTGTLVSLPPGARAASARLRDGPADAEAVTGGIMVQRGRPMVAVRVRGAGGEPVTVAVAHDGSWAAKAPRRLASAALHAALPGEPRAAAKSASPIGGSYVIITGPQYTGALAPLVDWKTRKGWPVTVVTTDETGTTNDGIHAWLQEAYDTWALPPEYVLLVGDVDVIPSWNFSGNVTDLPYSHLDGDDWLPDLMLGRFSVSNQTECATMVAKTVAYETAPPTDQTDWFTRGVMVAGQYASATPMHTVRFCGEQLASIGFDALDPITPVDLDGNYIVSPYIPQEGIGIPQNLGPIAVKQSIDAGCSMVVYRGWAYGINGWEPPHYTVDEIPQLANGAMTPVVMSFVCLNGDFSASSVCFGEAFTRAGGATSDQFKGAVAFIGNGEHWSHTRYNDAMAISVFERVTDPAITTLGGLLNAGKLRFMDYFPGQLEDQGDEESVEFYFHIYNLLGDPELNFYRAAPTAITATHADDLGVGVTAVDVAASEADGVTPLPGARVAVSQAGVLLGSAITGPDGTVSVPLSPAIADGAADIVVSHPDRLPYSGQAGGIVGAAQLVVDDLEPAAATPATALSIDPEIRNVGDDATAPSTVTLTVDGPAAPTTATASLPGLDAGATGRLDAPLSLTVDADAADGAVIIGRLAMDRGDGVDLAGFRLTVGAPDLRATAVDDEGHAWLTAGGDTPLTLTVENHGSASTAGATLALSLQAPDGVTLDTATLPLSAVPAGGSAMAGPVTVTVAQDVPGGALVTLRVTATCVEGAAQTTSVPLTVGDGNVAEPSGPDSYGYYAYDSADYLYPDQRPVYRWLELSTAFGGPGVKLPFEADNNDRDVTVDLPFSFTYYGQAFDRVRVADNGWISFEADNTEFNFYNWPIPSAHGNAALVAPFWDNLTPEPAQDPEADPVGLDSDGVYWHHDADAGEVIFEWSRMRHIYPEVDELQTFQVVLRDPAVHATPTGDGEILFFYRQAADNDHLRMRATVGLESPDETDGLQLTYDGIRAAGFLPPGPGGAVRLTTAAPERVPVLAASLDRLDAGERTVLQWTLDDRRPVLGWRVVALRDGVREPLGGVLPADRRHAEVDAAAEDVLVLEALLPHGAVCDAGKAAAGGTVTSLALSEPRPNPVRGEASIAFAVPRAGSVRLRVFDVRGRCVRTLVDGHAGGGADLVTWRGRDDAGRQLPGGVYFCRIDHDGRSLTRKLLLVR